jgi:hypothetical protein
MYKLLLVAFFSTSIIFAQEEDKSKPYNQFSIDGGIGLNKGLKSFTNGYSSKLSPISLNLGVRYMFNQKFGLKLDMGYDNLMKSSSSLDYTSQYTRGSIQAVANLATIFHFEKFTTKFGLLTHLGTGFSALSGNEFGLIKKADNSINLIVGLTPQFKVSEKTAVYLDFSYVSNLMSDYNYDLKSRISPSPEKSITSLINASIGISYKLGKAEKHYDWMMEKTIPVVDTVKSVAVPVVQEPIKDTVKVNVVEPNVTKVETFEDTLNVGKTIETIKNVEGKPVKTVVKVNENTQSINGMNGLFYTVQIGAYNYYMKVESHKKLESVYMITLPDGKVRFCTGVFANEKDAYQLLYKARELGFSDAFLTAYYNGIRIPVFKARELLRQNGPGIIDPKAVK